MNKEEFLDLFTQCVQDGDIDVDFVRGEDEYGSPCIKYELSVCEGIILDRAVFGFQFPQR